MKRLSAVLLLAAARLRADRAGPPEKGGAARAAPRPHQPVRPASPACTPRSTPSMGTIVAVLYEKEAPVTVQNFVALARGTKAWKDPKTGAMVAKPLIQRRHLSSRDS